MNSELMKKLESLLNEFQERALSLREEYSSITSIDNDLTKEDISRIKEIKEDLSNLSTKITDLTSDIDKYKNYDKEVNKNLVIFAGACQSYFEALISAGANFASSPARILIDFLDPLIVAEKVAITDEYKYISIDDICRELRDGKKGVDGIGANGKMKKMPL